MNCRELEDLILFHAGGAAEPGERRAVLQHLESGCPRCIGRLAEAQAALAPLPLALEPVTPSPAVRDRLMARVAPNSALGASATRTAGSDLIEHHPWPAARTSRTWMATALAAGLAAVLGGLAVYLPMQESRKALEARLVRQETRLASQEAQLRSLRAEMQNASMTIRMLRSPAVLVVTLQGQAQPGASARIFWDRTRGEWRFFAANLAPAGPGKTYQLWAVTVDQRKISAGTFDAQPSGEGELVARLPEGVGPIALAAVTDEPAGGVPQPTGTFQLLGKIPSSS